MRPSILAFALVLVLVAGCASAPTGPLGTSSSSAPHAAGESAKPAVFKASGTLTAGAGSNPGASFTLGSVSATGDVKSGATLVYVEMRWDSAMDLDLCVHLPASGSTGPVANCDTSPPSTGLPGMPDSPMHFTYIAPPTGGWALDPYPHGPVANTNFDEAFTVFYGETSVPAGYTAFS